MRSELSLPAMRRFYRGMAVVTGLAFAGLLPAMFGPWILDDEPLIATNARVQTLSAENAGFLFTHDMWDLDLSVTQTRERLVYFRPLVMLSYAVDWKLGGGSSGLFHVTNLLLHMSAILLATRALLRWGASAAGALLGAVYFGLHPARAESAAWISGRPDILATVGLLLSLEGVNVRRSTGRARGITLYVLGIVVAFGSKETALLLPLLVAIEVAAESGAGRFAKEAKAWPLGASLVAALGYWVARGLWLPMRPFPMKGLALTTHVGFVFETLGRATMYLLAPFDLSLSGPSLTERNGKVAPDPHYLALGAVAALVLAAALFWTWRRRQRAFWALLAFLLSIVPTLNIIWIGGLGLTSSRFFYLPSLLFAWFGIELGKGRFRSVTPRAASWMTYAGAAVLALLLGLHATTYGSSDLFWASELRSRPDVLANIESFVQKDWARGEPERALARSLCEYQMAAQRFSFMGEGARIILSTLDAWAKRLPDARRTELTAIADFLAVARQPNGPAVLRLSLALDVPPQGKVRSELVHRSAEVQSQEAAIRVRLGEPERALALVRAAREACPRCRDLLDEQAYVAYQAFEADYAEQLAQGTLDERWGELTKRARLSRLRELNRDILDAKGTKLLELRVQRLAELKLHGEALRALDQAARESPELASDPGFLHTRLTFAALAGEGDTAERLARELQVPAPSPPPPLSADKTEQYLAQLHDGCAFAEELE